MIFSLGFNTQNIRIIKTIKIIKLLKLTKIVTFVNFSTKIELEFFEEIMIFIKKHYGFLELLRIMFSLLIFNHF